MLYASNNIGDHHATFTFVLVVLGVALCLFGTGTQGIANIDVHPNTAAKINASLVGGAGVIALVVGLGMAHLRVDIRETFGVEKKYLRLMIHGQTGNSVLSAYVSQFQYRGAYVPSNYVGGNQIEVLVAFDEDELPWNHKGGSNEFNIDLVGVFVKKLERSPREESLVPGKEVPLGPITIKREHFLQTRGFNFPQHPERLAVNLEIERNQKAEAEDALKDSIRTTLDSKGSPQSAPPPVVVPAN